MADNLGFLSNKKKHLLIINEKHQKIEYNGIFELKITNLPESKWLLVSPVNEEYKPFSVKFDSLFIQQKHILCVYDADKFYNFALIFSNENISKKIFDIVTKNKPKISSEESNKIFYERFLNQLCETILTSATPAVFMKQLIMDLGNLYVGKEKENFINFLKAKNLDSIIFEVIKTEASGEDNPMEIIESPPPKNKTKNICIGNGLGDLSGNNDSNDIRNRFHAIKREAAVDEQNGQNLNNINSTQNNERKKSVSLQTGNLNQPHEACCTFHEATEASPESVDQGNCELSNLNSANSCEIPSSIMNESSVEKNSPLLEPTIPNEQTKAVVPEQSNILANTNPEISRVDEIASNQNLNKENYNLRRRRAAVEIININPFNDSDKNDSDFSPNNLDHPESEKELSEQPPNSSKSKIPSKKPKYSVAAASKKTETSKIIIKKPKYALKEQEKTGGKTIQRLIIFNPENMDLCYEFYWVTAKKCYACCGCIASGKQLKAKVLNEKTQKEYIELDDKEHVCQWRPYDALKYSDEKKIINLPNFELRDISNGIYKTLIIFDESNKNLCFEYGYISRTKYYSCRKCSNSERKVVKANLYYNEANNNEPYIILGHETHLCQMKPYLPETKEIIIELTHFKLIPNAKGAPKIIIFADDDRKKGYDFSISKSNICICLSCIARKSSNAKNKKDEKIALFSVKLCENGENGEKYIKLKNDLKHECQMKNFKADQEKKYEAQLVYAPNYVAYSKKNDKILRLAIYDANDRNLCYEFKYRKWDKKFECKKCFKDKNLIVTVRALKSENGEEFLRYGRNMHKCIPQNVKNIIDSNIEILKETGVAILEDENDEDDDQKIVKQGDFELRPNKEGIPEAELIIFNSNDRNLCYRYSYYKSRISYNCFDCINQKKLHVSAVLKTNSEGENYLILGKNEHQCKPIKYEPYQEIRYYDYTAFNLENNNNVTATLNVFISNSRSECYKYRYSNETKLFYCIGCRAEKKTHLNAKIFTDDNGKKYVKDVSNIKHECIPYKCETTTHE